ncbi:transglycosylase domain-containing protein [Microbacterium istanbulense]|uniref:Transglycosylase domain-containing protein n=1 Tax=Microbacterium istanbulense TaxID=3122049 RepID=A0ABU8LH98_9MICO
MPETKRSVKGVLGGLLGLVGLSAVAGLLVTATVTPAIAMAGFTGSTAMSLFEDLPDNLKVGTPMEPTTIYGTNAEGKAFQLATFYDQNRIPVTFDEVSPVLYDAILSSEDKSFYEHGGVNLGATVKAVVDNIRGTSSRGASTISQQFVKNVLIQECEKGVSPSEEDYSEKLNACWTEATQATGSEGVERKLQEMRYAIQIEKDYSKNDILLGYLNIANFGGQTYGIEAAANYYFGTTAAKLTLPQAATLAGIVQNPNRYRIDKPGGTGTDAEDNPTNGADDGYADTKVRRDYVIKRMFIDGKITEEQRDAAYETPIEPKITPSTQGCAAAGKNAYFCQYAKSIVENDPAFGETKAERQENLRRGGMQIYTSLDMRVQQAGIDAMAANAPVYLDGKDFGASGVTIETGTGRVLAIVQNTKFNETANANRAKGETSLVYAADKTHGNSNGMPPGSAYKLFTLIDWLEKGHSVNEVVNGNTRVFNNFTVCEEPFYNDEMIYNYNKQRGFTGTVRQFTAKSLNTGYLAMAEQLDTCDINKVAERMGVHLGNGGPVGGEPDRPNKQDGNYPYDSVLGSKYIAPIQMAGAYATVANKGKYCTPRAIDKVIGQDGKEMTLPESKCSQVIAPEVAATAAYALESVMQSGGTGVTARPYDGVPLIGKTGTHQSFATSMTESSTKTTTMVWAGAITGDFSMAQTYWNGIQMSQIRYYIARAMQGAANAAYGGDAFPAPDRNLTRQVLRDLPNVVGQPLDQARQTLENAGFRVNVGEAIDSEVAAGSVAEQTPGAGRVAGGTTVTLVPSTGKAPAPEEVDVPNVTGQKFSQAKKALEDAGLAVSGDCDGGDDVTAQEPAGGKAAPGTTITLVCD